VTDIGIVQAVIITGPMYCCKVCGMLNPEFWIWSVEVAPSNWLQG